MHILKGCKTSEERVIFPICTNADGSETQIIGIGKVKIKMLCTLFSMDLLNLNRNPVFKKP